MLTLSLGFVVSDFEVMAPLCVELLYSHVVQSLQLPSGLVPVASYLKKFFFRARRPTILTIFFNRE